MRGPQCTGRAEKAARTVAIATQRYSGHASTALTRFSWHAKSRVTAFLTAYRPARGIRGCLATGAIPSLRTALLEASGAQTAARAGRIPANAIRTVLPAAALREALAGNTNPRRARR